MKGDTRPANWARTLAFLRRQAVKLRAHGYEVIEPPNMDIPPHKRDGHPAPPV